MSFRFDESQVVGFGPRGQWAAKQMAEDVQKSFKGKCELSYNQVTKNFTILNSSEISTEALQAVFSKHKYDGWQPEVESLADSKGNKIVKLSSPRQSILDFKSNSATCRATCSLDSCNLMDRTRDSFELSELLTFLFPEKSKSGANQTEFNQSISNEPIKFNSARQKTAHDLVLKMKSLKINFENQKCLDVGCRSGENALAMQAAGAVVTAIDPDDSEFESALKIGIPKEQLHKLTLQDYYKASLKENFDVVTVFQYCIPLIECETFVDTLANIVKKNGTVVIGYLFVDGPLYDKNPDLNLPKLMKKYFKHVQRVVFPENINHYLLICRHEVS